MFDKINEVMISRYHFLKVSKVFKPIFILIISLGYCLNSSGNFKSNRIVSDTIYLADPTIFFHDGIYYLYGTGGNTEGFLVYESSDLKTWKGPVGANGGYALIKGQTYGNKGFWAPQVFKSGKRFFMAYTANENIAIAESDHPRGPFKQQSFTTISGMGKQIDPFVFVDDDGKKYLYHVRLQNGNRLFIAEMKDDFSDIKAETLKECISATESWENTANSEWPVAEGPTVLKHNNLYYLFYSANDFRNVDYSVGYAVADNPYGPWKKFEGNPIISRNNIKKNGPGHGDFIKDKNGDWIYVFHTHRSDSVVAPRITGIVKGQFIEDSSQTDKMVIDADSFYYLQTGKK